MTAQTLVAESSRRRRDKKLYTSGQYGSELVASSDEAEITSSSCSKRHCLLTTKLKMDNWISCEACENWFHLACVGIKTKRSPPEFFFCTACST